MCCKAARMGMISSRQAVLRRTSETGVQSRRSWESKAIRMGEDLEDFLARELASGCPEGILTREATFFEGYFCRESRKRQAQTRSTTATSKDLTHQPDAVALCAASPSGVAGETCRTVGANATPTAWNTLPHAPCASL